jgi:hypothetical protein
MICITKVELTHDGCFQQGMVASLPGVYHATRCTDEALAKVCRSCPDKLSRGPLYPRKIFQKRRLPQVSNLPQRYGRARKRPGLTNRFTGRAYGSGGMPSEL